MKQEVTSNLKKTIAAFVTQDISKHLMELCLSQTTITSHFHNQQGIDLPASQGHQYHCSLLLVSHPPPLPSLVNHIQMEVCLISSNCLCLPQLNHQASAYQGQPTQQQEEILSAKRRITVLKPATDSLMILIIYIWQMILKVKVGEC